MDRSPLELAAQRLARAVEALENAVARRHEDDTGRTALEFQIHAANDDRARLANELDMSEARARMLETTNRDVARRLDMAMDTIRSVLKTQASG